jgi:hypothetical protein
VEGTCNAQASDDRNWVEIQVLERRLQTVRPEGARFELHVLFARRGLTSGRLSASLTGASCSLFRLTTRRALPRGPAAIRPPEVRPRVG